LLEPDGHLIIVFKLPDSFYTALSRASVVTSSTVAPGGFSLRRYGLRGRKSPALGGRVRAPSSIFFSPHFNSYLQMTSTYPVKAMLTKLRRLVVGISKHLLLIQLLDSKRSERIPFRQFVHELVNAIQHAIPLPMRVLLHQLLPFLTVL